MPTRDLCNILTCYCLLQTDHYVLSLQCNHFSVNHYVHIEGLVQYTNRQYYFKECHNCMTVPYDYGLCYDCLNPSASVQSDLTASLTFRIMHVLLSTTTSLIPSGKPSMMFFSNGTKVKHIINVLQSVK